MRSPSIGRCVRRGGSPCELEALRAVLGHAFATLRLPELVATVDVPNQASHRLVERLGLRRSGERRGPRYPMLLYTLPAPGPQSAR